MSGRGGWQKLAKKNKKDEKMHTPIDEESVEFMALVEKCRKELEEMTEEEREELFDHDELAMVGPGWNKKPETVKWFMNAGFDIKPNSGGQFWLSPEKAAELKSRMKKNERSN